MTGHTKLAQRFGRTRISGVYLHAMWRFNYFILPDYAEQNDGYEFNSLCNVCKYVIFFPRSTQTFIVFL